MTQALSAARGVYGAYLLVGSRRLLEPLTGPGVDPLELAVCRILGVRQLLQAGLAGRHGTRRSELVGALVDGTHAVTMVLWADRSSRRRSFALRAAAAGAAFSLAGALAALSASSAGARRSAPEERY